MYKKIMFSCAIILGLILTGCASVPMASLEKDTAAKAFATQPGKANIYVYRHETMGAAVKMPVALNGKLVGDTAAKTYLLLDVEPGNHTLVSKTENDAVLNVAAEAGKNYYVWQEVKMGLWSARSALHLVDEKKGREDIAECKLIEAGAQ